MILLYKLTDRMLDHARYYIPFFSLILIMSLCLGFYGVFVYITLGAYSYLYIRWSVLDEQRRRRALPRNSIGYEIKFFLKIK